MFDLLDDTIAAVASPPGHAPRGIVRCSGPEAIPLAGQVFTAEIGVDLAVVPGFRRLAGSVTLEPRCDVPAELFLFRGPRSYTRQDCVEFHVPGSPSVLAMLLDRLVQLGGRHAEPGEFTARAFLAGAMDLSQVEAVARTIHARSDAQLRAAQRALTGQLANRIERVLEELAELVALVEADIDFAEEPIEFITPAQLKERLKTLQKNLGDLVGKTASDERINVLPHILLVGRSNVGKSTLMNRLTDLDRAICSPVAGTTRDLLSAPIRLGRGEAVLLDAAGVDPNMEDLMAAAGATTCETAGRVDLLCMVVDLSREPDDSVLEFRNGSPKVPYVVVGNKIDLLDKQTLRRRKASLGKISRSPVCLTSATCGDGLDQCRQLLTDALALPDTCVGGDVLVVTVRQREALASSLAAIQRCISEASDIGETIDRADILAFELREALESLGSVVGSVTTEDLLSRVFASFCIGK
ncbi:MAG: GTP-binding protein [Planctomycetes bacterium]|nr:GTP-binding protein [Planctomycetota bacterium]